MSIVIRIAIRTAAAVGGGGANKRGEGKISPR